MTATGLLAGYRYEGALYCPACADDVSAEAGETVRSAHHKGSVDAGTEVVLTIHADDDCAHCGAEVGQ